MSEIRKLAMRLALSVRIPVYMRDTESGADALERLVRAAMREGMLRSADISKLYANEEEESSSFQCGAAACERMIRAEAAKLETN